jgi:hypothetical protein
LMVPPNSTFDRRNPLYEIKPANRVKITVTKGHGTDKKTTQMLFGNENGFLQKTASAVQVVSANRRGKSVR